MNASKLNKTAPVRMLIHGFPGSGKTGSLVSLANAGFKIRMLDFDGNPEPLLKYTDPKFLSNIDIVSLKDKLDLQPNGLLAPSGQPMAFTNGIRLMKQWRYPDPDGAEVDAKGVRWTNLGSSDDWGPDTIVVLDSLTGLGDASMNRARFMANKTALNMTQAVWGLAITEQLNFIKRLVDPSNKHHTVVISHVKIVGPKTEAPGDSELAKEFKQEAAGLIQTKLHPTALGWDLPQHIHKEFPTTLHIDKVVLGKHVKRRFDFAARKDMDLKLPAADLAALTDLDIRNGLLRIFKALGAVPPVNGA